jgi:hypothetical protein
MTKRTRLFLVISATVLVLGLGTGLLASYMGGMQNIQLFGSDGPAELAYVPQDVGLVAYANVRDVMGSQLRQKLLELKQNNPDNPDNPDNPSDSDNFETETGINIERDVDTVVAAVASGAENRFLVLARGRFDQPRIEALVQQRGGTIETYNGQKLLTVTDDDHTFGLSFVEGDLAAVGSAADVRRAIDTKAGTVPNVTANAEIMNLVRDMDAGNAWAVGRFDAIARNGRLPEQVANQLPPINWFAATGHINGGVEGLLRVEANTDQAAVDLRQVIQGFMALARLQTRSNPDLTAMLDSMQLGGEGKTVSLAFSVPPEMIDMLAGMRRAQADRQDAVPDLPERRAPSRRASGL